MSKDDKGRKRLVFTWKNAVAWTVGSMLKLAGFLGIICGLLTIALAGMDVNPTESIVSGVAVTCLGLVLLYVGYKIATTARRA